MEKETKVVNDPIHGSIELHPLCVKIIDTPQFQRLRYLKQMGGCYYVFPGASHNRFEHSIGVCHLAGLWARSLQTKQPELDITEKDVLCVEIAGLCHDLGHGPFSHLFEKHFLHVLNPEVEWKHEIASVKMFLHIVKNTNCLLEELKSYSLTKEDLKSIAKQIAGPKLELDKDDLELIGKIQIENGKKRDDSKYYFLCQIMANQKTGIDVDKFDYFARDCYHLGLKNNFDHLRLMQFSRVIEVDKKKEICYRDKEIHNIYDMFAVRERIHRHACQHKTTKVIEHMIGEALVKANECKVFGGKSLRLCDTISDMEAYTRVHDSIYHQILFSQREELAPARKILERIECRQFYTFIGQLQPINRQSQEEIKKSTTEILQEDANKRRILSEDIVILTFNFDYGKDNKDPVDDAYFYKKNDINKAIKGEFLQVSKRMLPANFSDQILRVYCKNKEEKPIAEECFKQWFAKNKDQYVKETDNLDNTP